MAPCIYSRPRASSERRHELPRSRGPPRIDEQMGVQVPPATGVPCRTCVIQGTGHSLLHCNFKTPGFISLAETDSGLLSGCEGESPRNPHDHRDSACCGRESGLAPVPALRSVRACPPAACPQRVRVMGTRTPDQPRPPCPISVQAEGFECRSRHRIIFWLQTPRRGQVGL